MFVPSSYTTYQKLRKKDSHFLAIRLHRRPNKSRCPTAARIKNYNCNFFHIAAARQACCQDAQSKVEHSNLYFFDCYYTDVIKMFTALL
jgi:hypothetical protein